MALPVLIPYASRHPATVAGAPGWAEWVDVSADPHAYWRTMCDWWARGESFLVIEHDVVCRPDVVEAVTSCPEPWCAFPYRDMCCQDETGWSPCMEAWANTLGCTRFRADLIAAVPDAVSGITRPEHLDWHNLCDGIGGNLRTAGFRHHWHLPAIQHHHMGRNGPVEET